MLSEAMKRSGQEISVCVVACLLAPTIAQTGAAAPTKFKLIEAGFQGCTMVLTYTRRAIVKIREGGGLCAFFGAWFACLITCARRAPTCSGS
jgi:hypothetical protein